MKIEKVYYINLDYRTDKHHAQQTACFLAGVPGERVERFPARISTIDIPPIEEIARRMDADGFTAWSHIDSSHWFKPSWLASTWSKVSLLRHVIERNECAIMMSDTMLFHNLFFPELEKLIDQLPDFKMLFLGLCAHEKREKKLPPEKRSLPSPVYGILANFHGLPMNACVATPEGASELLKMHELSADSYNDEAFFLYALDNDISGYYCCDPPLVGVMDYNNGSYSFFASDKEDVGKYIYRTKPTAQWVPACTGGL